MLRFHNTTSDTNSNDSNFTFEQFPSDPAEKVKFSMAYISRYLAAQKEPPNKDRAVQIRGSNIEEAHFFWTALMVFGQNTPNMKFGSDAIKNYVYGFNEHELESVFMGFGEKFRSTSLYETIFKRYLTPAMLKISASAALYEGISGLVTIDEQLRQKKQILLREHEQSMHQKQFNGQANQLHAPQQITNKQQFPFDFLIALEKLEQKKHNRNPMAYDLDCILETTFLNDTPNHDVAVKVNYSMALAITWIARIKPSEPLRVYAPPNWEGACPNSSPYIWTSLMLLGSMLPGKKFDDNQIFVIFHKPNDKGWFSLFSFDSLYATAFKQHLNKDCVILDPQVF